MVKGVNKTVIEVNDTGSKMFEKIVFYVTPQYGTLSAKQLRRAAREFSFSFSEPSPDRTPSLRKRIKNKKKKKAVIFGATTVAVIAAAVLIFAF